ncbi:MAG: hypothetical protein H6741_26960 [Alphaproteobacteria bacterium]|nr:hypothetical protein [Alphaproteobacteria bacterium]
MNAPEIRCGLRLSPHGDELSVAFELENRSPRGVGWTYFHPFCEFDLEARGPDGAPVRIEQSAWDGPVEQRRLVLPPGSVAWLTTPIRLRCQPRGPADPDPFTWTLRHPPRDLSLRASLRLDGPAIPAALGQIPPEAPTPPRPAPTAAPARSERPPLVAPSREALAARYEAQLAAALAAPPSREAWSALRRLVADWPVRALGELPLPRMQAALAGWPAELRELSGDFEGLGRGGAAGPMGELARVVRIYRHSKGSAQLGAVARAPELGQVTTLYIIRSEVYAGAFGALAASTTLRALRELILVNLTVTEQDASQLGGGPIWRQLTHFAARGCHLYGPKLRLLFERSDLSSLQRLDLSSNPLTPADLSWLKARLPRGAGLIH